MGVLPQDEDPILPGNNINGVVPFDFFGFGQRVNWHQMQMPPHQPIHHGPEPKLALQIQPAPLNQDFDLNVPEPVVEAMAVDNVHENFSFHQGEIDLNVEPMEEQLDHQESQILIVSDSNSNDEIDEEINIDNPPDQEQQVLLALPALPDMNHLPLEIQEDELMSDNDSSEHHDADHDMEANVVMAHNQQQVASHEAQGSYQFNGNLQIGMVQLVPQFVHDSVLECFTGFGAKEFSWTPSKNDDGVRLWAKYFAPVGHNNNFVIPQCWSDFFTVLLLNPGRFDWAKTFISSKAWDLITSEYSHKHGRHFVLPSQCPTDSAPKCLIEEISNISQVDNHEVPVSQEDTTITAPESNLNLPVSFTAGLEPLTPVSQTGTSSLAATTSALHLKRKATKAPMVDSDLRRSEGIKKITKGFKGKACMDKRCICCSIEPPTLSSKVIRILGETLCKISPTVISDESLLQKPKVAVKKQAATKKDKAADSNGDNNDKSMRKPKKN
ncbi:hypothetical protein QOZ80_7AG0555350 [Eleusine coracana subsp. coracana]|nr:hypothetical protein QOZ80_7AG0555350 [Eleusine coracana subsp. coracana]